MEETTDRPVNSANPEMLSQFSPRMRKILVNVRAAVGGLMLATIVPMSIGHFGEDKSLEEISEQAFWVLLAAFAALIPVDYDERRSCYLNKLSLDNKPHNIQSPRDPD